MADPERAPDDLLAGLPRSRPHRRSVHRDAPAAARAKPARATPKRTARRPQPAPARPATPVEDRDGGGVDVIGAAVGAVSAAAGAGEALLRRAARRLPGR